MKKIVFKFAKIVVGLFMLIGFVAYVTGFDPSGFFINGGLVSMAAAGAGAVSTNTVTKEVTNAKSSDLLVQSISEKVVELKPTATPVDTILREIGFAPIMNSWERKFYEVDSRGFSDEVNVPSPIAAGNDESEGQNVAVKVTDIHIWNVDDIVLFVGLNGAPGTGDFVAHIESIDVGTKTLTVVAVNGTGANLYDWPEIPDATKLIWLGNSKDELAAQTEPYHIFPQSKTNYAQRFMAQVEESLFMFDADKEVKWNINNHKIQSMYSYRLGQELATLFGAKGYKLVGSKYYHHMGGIVPNITKTSTYTDGSMTPADYYQWMRVAFTLNSGSKIKYVFGGGEFMEQLNALEPVQKQMSATNTFMQYGITFNEITSIFGTFRTFHHDLLNSVGWEKKAIVLDMPYISRPIRKKLKTSKLELVKSGQSNANAFLLDETFTIGTEYLDAHMIIEPA